MTREEAIRELELIAKVTVWNDRREAVNMAIEALSADAVQVVRCKDCKWFKPNQLAPVHPLLGGGIVYENQCERCLGIVPNEDGYCSRGERKEP